MLIIPIEGKLSLRNLPIVTLLLIAINCFVFFVIQSGDTRKVTEARQYYFESGLAAIELPLYADHIASETGKKPEIKTFKEPNRKNLVLLTDMQRDSDFMNALYHDQIIVAGSPEYNTWANKRAKFEQLRNRSVTHSYGLVPAKAKPWMFVTMMFIHGGLWHLLGNMVFLWIVGCVLEMGLGRLLYFFCYILGGIFASVVYFAVHHNSYVPGIGASGAIAALMGALTVLYGFTRIRVFFSTGFYFDYFRMPAILLLPLWLGKELLAFYFGSAGGVAYMAHAGGLAGGAGLAAGLKQVMAPAKKAFFKEAPEDPAPELIEKAMEKVSRLDFEGARPMLYKVLEINPRHEEALSLLFNLEKQEPETKRFDEAAQKYLSLLLSGQNDSDKIYRVYNEYAGLSGRSGLPDHMYARLAAVFLEAGKIEAGKKILVYLIRQRPNLESLPALLLRLVNALKKQNMNEKAEKYRQILCKRYPQSQEARIAGSRHPEPS
ncbi:MAG: rhomboid family intramembrane serine protease [Desulfobacterales bacterium]|nr:rhomboid family intramembrane serine protease [Desulfobacterales bacterium]